MKLLLTILAISGSMALAKPAGSSALNPEVLSTKALLEDLLARRYAQSLATVVDKGSFTVGAQLDLVVIPPVVPRPAPALAAAVQPEGISDLLLGTLDPEDLIKKVSDNVDQKVVAKNLLGGFRIKTVNVSVGLRDNLDPTVKAEVTKWLNGRVTAEFGKAGKGEVALIKAPLEKPLPEPAPKTWLDNLNQFQSLAGQMVIGFALLIAVLLWQLLAKPAVGANGESSVRVSGSTSPGEAAAKAADAERQVREESERLQATTEINHLTDELRRLIPGLSTHLEEVVRMWCQLGEDGKLRLAAFAEAVGREFGRLPIPADALNDVSKVFARMPKMPLGEKRDILQKAYWDLLSAVNLGTETLSQPFGYLGGVNVDLVNQMLIDQNPKMKTLVSLFMPDGLRADYLKSLRSDDKLELLKSAAALNEIPARELRELDGSFASKLNARAGGGEVVPLGMTLEKLVAALTPFEEITLLRQLDPTATREFRRQRPTLAFLGDWPSDKLARLLTNVMADELVAYLRVVPELRTRLLELSPTMTADMATEELDAPDRQAPADRDRHLAEFSARLTRLVRSKEIRLEDVFPIGHDNADDQSNVSRLNAA